MTVTRVEDVEHLYRSVKDDPKLHSSDEKGVIVRLSASAFNCRHRQPSVDRAVHREGPDAARKGPDNGVVVLVAGEVRILTFEQLDAKQKPIKAHRVEVMHRPLLDNYSHAQIEPLPEVANENIFRKLKERLAFLARTRGWVAPPASVSQQGR